MSPSLPLTDADDYEWKYNGHVNPHLFQRKNAEVWVGGAWKVYDPPTEGSAENHYDAFYAANAVDGWRSRCRWCGDFAEDDDGDTEMHATCDPDFMKGFEDTRGNRARRYRVPATTVAREAHLELEKLRTTQAALVKACEAWMEHLGPGLEEFWREQKMGAADHLAAIRAAVLATK